MELSLIQAEAALQVKAWLDAKNFRDKPYFYIGGYAGTGKSTIVKSLTEGMEHVLYGTFTGKAASVLQKKGVLAGTIHSLIYSPLPLREEYLKELYAKKAKASEAEAKEIQKLIKEEVRPKFTLNKNSPLLDAELVVIDEVSMVNEEMGKDLLSFKVPILVLGDPGQLPPVAGEGFFTRNAPDVMLTEIHRQAAGNPIIAMATLARQGRRLSAGAWGDSQVVWKNKFQEHTLATAYDQIICGRNATRKAINARVRDFLGHLSACPLPGEKVICLKNNKELGILNGTQWQVQETVDNGRWFTLGLRADGETDEKKDILIDCHPFDADFDNMPWYDKARFEEFDFGYAITCHKSQGSQWPTVCIQNESWIFKENQSKWLYTALTRAEKSVTVIL